MTGSHDAFNATKASDRDFGEVTEEILTGRKYIVIRAVADTPVRAIRLLFPQDKTDVNAQEESGKAAQKRLIQEFYDTAEDANPQ